MLVTNAELASSLSKPNKKIQAILKDYKSSLEKLDIAIATSKKKINKMQCTRLPATPEEEQREEMIITQTATMIPNSPAVGDLAQAAMEHGQQLHYTELDETVVRLIPDCLEHIFKYLSTSDKGRVAQVKSWG